MLYIHTETYKFLYCIHRYYYLHGPFKINGTPERPYSLGIAVVEINRSIYLKDTLPLGATNVDVIFLQGSPKNLCMQNF